MDKTFVYLPEQPEKERYGTVPVFRTPAGAFVYNLEQAEYFDSLSDAQARAKNLLDPHKWDRIYIIRTSMLGFYDLQKTH